jgi:hypothetical protein
VNGNELTEEVGGRVGFASRLNLHARLSFLNHFTQTFQAEQRPGEVRT